LIYAALQREMPILAICRGIQALNVALGGTLYQDIPSQIKNCLCHQQTEPRHTATHAIQIEPCSQLSQIVGAARLETNSMHHQAVREVGEGLRVTARADDGVIEALEDPRHRYLVAVQFHPEEMALSPVENSSSQAAQSLFRSFLAACSRS
jgi:putative glutamine amidotransferase